jgi:hypothetical protein|nr:MAG TPA: major capsid protein [Caudoviricetes sp.]
MLLDALNRFSDKQAVTATAVSTNVIDLGAERDLAVHSSLEVVVIPCTATGADLTGAATVSVSVETSATEEFTTSKTLVTTAALSADDLNKGAFGIKLPYGGQRFLRLKYTLAGTEGASLTGLLITSGLTIATPHDIHYPRAMHS